MISLLPKGCATSSQKSCIMKTGSGIRPGRTIKGAHRKRRQRLQRRRNSLRLKEDPSHNSAKRLHPRRPKQSRTLGKNLSRPRQLSRAAAVRPHVAVEQAPAVGGGLSRFTKRKPAAELRQRRQAQLSKPPGGAPAKQVRRRRQGRGHDRAPPEAGQGEGIPSRRPGQAGPRKAH